MRTPLLFLAFVACSTTPAPRASAPAPPAAAPATWHASEIKAGDVTLHAEIIGDAAPTTIVALHGGPGLSLEYMKPFGELAKPGVRVVAYDQRGTGRSTMPADHDAHMLENHADDLEAVRVALAADKLDLVGHSYGGLVAMAYAAKYTAHVRSLIFVDTMPPSNLDFLAGQWYISLEIGGLKSTGLIPTTLPDVEGDDCEKQLVALLPVYFYDHAHPLTKHLAGSSCHREIGDRTRSLNSEYDFTAALGPLAIPTIVIHGEADPFRRQMADRTIAAFTTAKPKLELLAKCGHVPFEECPDRFWPIVRAFLDRRP